jgi:starch phosphorylase
VPRFYEREDDGLPHRWLGSIRHTLATLSGELSADRMVREYTERLYLPAAEASAVISAEAWAPAKGLAAWKSRVRAAWPSVTVQHVDTDVASRSPLVGDEATLRAGVVLGDLDPADVAVQVVYGRADANDQLIDPVVAALQHDGVVDGVHQFVTTVPLTRAGAFGYTVRVVPSNALLASDAELGLIAVAA